MDASKKQAMLLMVVCALLWSLGGIFIKLISWSPLLIAGGRSLISGMVLALFMLFQKIPVRISRFSILAGIGLSASCTFFVIANKLTTAANAVVLQYMAPIFVLVISALFLKKKIHTKDIAVVAVTLAGIVLFFFDQLSPGNILGNIFGILAGVFLAIMFVAVGGGGEDDSVRMTGILIAHSLTALIGIPIGIMQTGSAMSMEFLWILILGVFQLGIPYVLYAVASKNCPPLACSLIGMLEPLFNPVWVFLFAGEMPGFYALTGAVIIIAAVSWWCIADSKAEQDDSAHEND